MSLFHLSSEETTTLLKFFPQGLVCLDLETTGLSPLTDQIIEIAAVKLSSDGQIAVFDTLINPKIKIPEHTILIHQITDDMVQNSPLLPDILKDFMDFTEGLPLVAHNAQFDIGFIVMALHLYKVKFSFSPVYDSCRFARRSTPKAENYKLKTLAEFFAIPLTKHHRALEDTWACLRVFAQCLINGVNFKSQKDRGLLYSLDSFKNLKDIHVPKHLNPLLEKLITQEILEIEYIGGTIKEKFRPIRPIGLLPLPRGTVLQAKCLLSNQFKSFCVKKIKTLKFLNKANQELWEQYESQYAATPKVLERNHFEEKINQR